MTTRGQQGRPAGNSHVVADQSEVAAFLAQAKTYGPDTGQVLRLDTHGAMVFLAGRRAYKVKRAVKIPYLDYSTLAHRRACCQKEVEVNRRTAPDLYLGVEAVTRTPDGGLALGGSGPAVEWLVVMARFRQEDLFDRLAEDGKLTSRLMAEMTDAITSFPADAKRLFGDAARGGGAAGRVSVVFEIDGTAVDEGSLDASANLQRLAVDQDQAGRLADLDRSEPIFQPEDARRRCRDRAHCLVPR